MPDQRSEFIARSAELTGFSADELLATGVVDEYLAVVVRELGIDRYCRLLLDDPDPAAARAVTRLWYTGSWDSGGDTYVVSPRAYAAGLVWRAIGVPAPGTAGAGYGSWATAP
ncbi:hypothetical protein ACFW1A_07690 [Kitasatospora sp. NPDC058965]|uniref:hypothetical protein n=1 Tax=Kitasatospora sp. NPDC058965 TaxID=3346682 RepID=UPI00369DB0D8